MKDKGQILKDLQQKSWYKNSDRIIKENLANFPDKFLGFMNDLVSRPDNIGIFAVNRMISISFANHFALPVFEVINTKTKEISEYEYIGRKRGRAHSIRGLVMVESLGVMQYFIMRKTHRFALASEVFESMGSIYPPAEEVKNNNFSYKSFLEIETAKQLRLEKVSFDRFYDLGVVYPDVGMTYHEVNLFAAVIQSDNPKDVLFKVNDKTLNDKNYEYSFVAIPTDQLLTFLAKTSDAHLLAIFGRLQALNVIKI